LIVDSLSLLSNPWNGLLQVGVGDDGGGSGGGLEPPSAEAPLIFFSYLLLLLVMVKRVSYKNDNSTLGGMTRSEATRQL